MKKEIPEEDGAHMLKMLAEGLAAGNASAVEAAEAFIMANPPTPRFVDLREIPIPKWPIHEYFQVPIPEHIFERIKGRAIDIEEANALEVEMEAFYGVCEPFWLQYEGKGAGHAFEFRREV